ncbi:L-threonylcarbamoyladenylate synthase [Flavobacterium sp. XGLA_31]|uniref:L-threonylcarbamoyladenylate synthase n=1 Tax=Flavobacterium sp. XGLA_31 TaxID=3447666 RepID=UPI003F408FC4
MISNDIYQAAHLLYKDEVVAIPTETVYGLAANIYSEKAVKKVFELKNRPFTNPLIVHIGSKNQLDDLAEKVPEIAQKLIDRFWPGPLTLILRKKNKVPDFVTGGKETVAIRMPNHGKTLQLLNLLPFPIAAPSANPFGSISPTSPDHVAAYFEHTIPMILDGGICQNGLESTIIGFENEVPTLYRLGSITVEELEHEIGPIKFQNFEENKTIAPGMMNRHYAPDTLTIVSTNIAEALHLYKGKKIGLLLFSPNNNYKNVAHQEVLSVKADLKEAAANLYAALHRLDAQNLDVIVTEQFPLEQWGRAINDRLKRASHPVSK